MRTVNPDKDNYSRATGRKGNNPPIVGKEGRVTNICILFTEWLVTY
jgi:hypothetical protein